MCTVTFLPAVDGSYLLATNRDERPARTPAEPPARRLFGSVDGLAPRDPDAGGTWVAVLESGHTVCLLNGDDSPRGPSVHDPVSRGVVCVDVASSVAGGADVEQLTRAVLAQHDHAVRPFKLLVVTPGLRARLDRVEWTGAEVTALATSMPHVAVSSTHMRADVTSAREAVFDSWQAVLPQLGDAGGSGALEWVPAVENFHAGHAPGAAAGDAFSVCMHRDDARSVSSTLVAVTTSSVAMRYRRGWPCETHAAPADHSVELVRAPAERQRT